MDSIPSLPTDNKKIPVPGFGVFVRTSLASTKVRAKMYNCVMYCEGIVDFEIDSYSCKISLLNFKFLTFSSSFLAQTITEIGILFCLLT